MGYILFFLFAAGLLTNGRTMPPVPRRAWNVKKLLLTAAPVRPRSWRRLCWRIGELVRIKKGRLKFSDGLLCLLSLSGGF